MKFRAYELSIELIHALRDCVKRIRTFDRDLSNQITRAASGIALNLAEGSGREMGDRMQLFRTALGSAKEVKAALEVASGWGWLPTDEARQSLVILDELLRICWRLTHPR